MRAREKKEKLSIPGRTKQFFSRSHLLLRPIWGSSTLPATHWPACREERERKEGVKLTKDLVSLADGRSVGRPPKKNPFLCGSKRKRK